MTERERHGLGDFGVGDFVGFPEAWALPVASCLCRAYTMPTHYNILKKVSWTLTPGRVFKETKQKKQQNKTTEQTKSKKQSNNMKISPNTQQYFILLGML